jgi:small subunit ribosomal protein S15
MEAKMSEQTMRVLDLRNADAKGVRKESVRRIVEVFGGDLNANNNNNAGSGVDGKQEPVAPRMNTGHPTVTSAILTHRIHLLNTHLAANPRDVHNKKRLRELVHQRAKILNYYKKRVGRRGGEGEGAYLGLLDKLGLDRRGVEGELIVR